MENKSENVENSTIAQTDANTVLCAVCKSDDRVEFLTITDCDLCKKCQDELSDGFEQAMKIDRSDYPEL